MMKSFLCIMSIVFFFYACKKETGVPGPAGAPGTNGLDGSLLDTGTLAGNLAVYDEFSWPMSDSSGVKISLQKSGTTISTTSDRSGNYFFHGLPAGTYNLVYEKANFGTMKVFGVSHSPGSNLNTTVPEVYVLQNPVKTAVDSIKLVSNGLTLFLTIYLDTSSLSYLQPGQNFAMFISSNPHPGMENSVISPLSNSILADGHGGLQLWLLYQQPGW